MSIPSRAGLARLAAALAFAAAAAGCSTVNLTADKIEYQSAPAPRTLEIPPDLSQLPRDDRFTVPERGGPAGSATASATAAAAAGRSQPRGGSVLAVAPAVANARIEREGTQRWLVVDVPPERAFSVVQEFLPTVGLQIEREDAQVGIVETAWAENRANLPQSLIRGLLGRFLGQVFSTGEMDKFRFRVERTSANTSEIFVSHRGMVEVFTSQAQDSTKWQPRPSDPELEVELLQRLAQRFAPGPAPATAVAGGVAPGAGKTPVSTVPEIARLLPADAAEPARVRINEPFDRAWRRVGLALDRGGFTVEDRDRARGLYFVRYLDPEIEQRQRDRQGFLSKLFGRDAKIEAQQFRVLVAASGEATVVTVQDRDGKPDASPTAGKILAQINDQLR
ncbi:MAG: outer membrane protein assembly factor BamC [Burkholderiaceae bacterium]|jgi:outer membrane protein assembly factor BamC|nr:outer membrane protein assembly factor BamC [Burkholderiaceae bacterium]